MGRLAFLLLSLVYCLVGCASVSVRPVHESGTRPVLPSRILVSEFGFEGANIRSDRQGERAATFNSELASKLSDDTIQAIRKLEVPAARSDIDPNLHVKAQRAWLVRGNFIEVAQGSRALRSLVGFGAGATAYETEVEVIDLARPDAAPILVFQTTGGSGSEPGAIISVNPYFIALGAGLKAIRPGVTGDSKRTGRMIAAYLVQTMKENGAPLSEKGRKAKPKMYRGD